MIFNLVNIYSRVVEFLEGNMLKCYTKSITGHDCPGCGLQRSIVHLMRGEFVEAFHMYPGIYPILLTILFLVIRIKIKSDWSLIALKYSYFTTAIFILVNFISKLI